MKLKDEMLGETIYPSGLRYNGEMLLYLLTSGKLVFVKYFFKNYTKTNTSGFKLKEILENIIDEDWFTEQKRQVDYELSEELKPYLKRERFNKISELAIDKGKKLVRLCNQELKLLKRISYRSGKNYLILLQILYELLKIDDKDLYDEVLFSMGRIFSTTENPIYNHIVASRYFKELADDKSSVMRFQAAEAYANIIRFKTMGRLGGPNEALPYLEIAIDLKKADVYFATYSVCVELGREDDASKYLKLAADMNYNLAIEKCKRLNIR